MKTPTKSAPVILRAIGYGRVSTDEQAESGAGLDAQRAAITEAAARRGWGLVEYIEDRGFSGKNLERPGIQCALEHLREHRADVLLVAKVDRLSRSVHDFSDLLERRSQREGWSIVALDIGVDTSTPTGEAMANMTATFSRLERRLIGQRTREAMAIKKSQGSKFGRKERVRADVIRRIRLQLASGASLNGIARRLNDDGEPTPQRSTKAESKRLNTRWHASTVRSVLATAEREASKA